MSNNSTNSKSSSSSSNTCQTSRAKVNDEVYFKYEGERQVVYDLCNGSVYSDLEWTLT